MKLSEIITVTLAAPEEYRPVLFRTLVQELITKVIGPYENSEFKYYPDKVDYETSKRIGYRNQLRGEQWATVEKLGA